MRIHVSRILGRVLRADAPPPAVLIRLVVGLVFASEGVQKFLYADAQGAGRFARIGIPAPEVTASMVAATEVVCGCLLLVGLGVRFAAAPLLVTMIVALASTKVPILLGRGYWLFSHTFAPKDGVWAFLHESRTDLAMLSGALFLALVGGDRWSLDRKVTAARLRGESAMETPRPTGEDSA